MDWSKAEYLSWPQLVDVEKDKTTAKNIMSYCSKLGYPYVKYDSPAKCWRFLHQREGTTEALQKAWTMKQQMQSTIDEGDTQPENVDKRPASSSGNPDDDGSARKKPKK